MPEEQARSACEKAGSLLLQYRAATKAVVRLPDSRKIAVTIERDLAWIAQTHGLVDLLVDMPVLCSWNLALFQAEERASCRPSRAVLAAAVLDTLVECLAPCDSLDDVITKAASGALDPFETVICRFDALRPDCGPAGSLQPTGAA